MNETKRINATQVDTATIPTLDARKHARGEQIRGALRYNPEALLKVDKLVLPLDKERPVAVYAETDEAAERIVRRLYDQGYAEAAVLDGGLDAWKAAGKATEELSQEQPVPGDQEAGIHDV